MALANTPVLLTLLMAFCGVCFGEIYQVGDSNGWMNNGVNYTLWASYRNFIVGDVLHFKYDKNENNVVRLLHKEFRSCKPEHEIYKLNTGDDYIRLNRPGNFFFISSVNGHCQSGQKLHVSVSKSVPSPTLTPVPSSSPSQSPVSSSTSHTAPEAAPIAAPKAAPVAAPKAAPVAAPKASATAALVAAPRAASTPKNAPIAAPTSEFDGPPTPPDLPIDLIPAPKAAPPSPPKSSAQTIQSSMPFLMATVFIACIVVFGLELAIMKFRNKF